MLTANATLAIFAMLGISSLAIFWAKRVKLPHSFLGGDWSHPWPPCGIPDFSLF